MSPPPGARTRAEQLRRLHDELASLIRRGLAERQDPVILRTERATLAARTITISLAEAHTLLRACAPPSAHDAPTKIAHGLLAVATRHLLACLHETRFREVPASTVRAAIILLDVLRGWLAPNNVVVMRAGDRATDPLTDRPREPHARIDARRLRSPRRTTRRAR